MAAASRATMSSGWRSAQPRLLPYAPRTVSKISSLRRWSTLFSCCFRRRAHIIGVSVRDTTSDSRIAADSVSANSRRSEEHTSELQSHHDLVCRLLLEKKKNIKHYIR